MNLKQRVEILQAKLQRDKRKPPIVIWTNVEDPDGFTPDDPSSDQQTIIVRFVGPNGEGEE